jgi:hypothetical protein
MLMRNAFSSARYCKRSKTRKNHVDECAFPETATEMPPLDEVLYSATCMCVGHLGFVHLLSFNAVNTVQVHSSDRLPIQTL